MKRLVFLFAFTGVTVLNSVKAQTYHDDDKDGLRVFLRQSGRWGSINAQGIGLEISDTLHWQNSESWVEKIVGLTWDNESPKRLIEIDWGSSMRSRSLEGTLNAGKWSNLVVLVCWNGELTAIDVSKNIALTHINCHANRITALDVSKNTALKELICYGNSLNVLDVSKNTALLNLQCHGNQLTALDVSANIQLRDLSCGGNRLTVLDVSANTELVTLNCCEAQLSTLDIRSNTQLTALTCWDNVLTNLDVHANTKLTALHCSSNRLTALDVSENKELEWLRCSGNSLTELDLSGNTALTEVVCQTNMLTLLDMSDCKELIWLECDVNRLTELDVNANTKLYHLGCYGNQLTALDVNANTELSFLNCGNNQINAINITENKVLTYFYCNDNQINKINMNENSIFWNFYCQNNCLALSELFSISESIVYEDFSPSPIEVIRERYFGSQYLNPQTVSIGDEIDYSDQSVFKGIETQFAITKDGIPATQNDYSITGGKITFTRSGNYVITMTNEAIIAASNDPVKVIVEIAVGTVDNEKKLQNAAKVKAYPNPTRDQLRITVIDQLRMNGFEIFDLSGQIVMRGKLQGETTTLYMNSLAGGVYYLRIADEVVKFIKQ